MEASSSSLFPPCVIWLFLFFSPESSPLPTCRLGVLSREACNSLRATLPSSMNFPHTVYAVLTSPELCLLPNSYYSVAPITVLVSLRIGGSRSFLPRGRVQGCVHPTTLELVVVLLRLKTLSSPRFTCREGGGATGRPPLPPCPRCCPPPAP